MPFQPNAIDSATLQKLAKNLKKALANLQPNARLPLSQAQEVLARTFGYPDWHAACAHNKKEITKADKPSSSSGFNGSDTGVLQAIKDAGLDPALVDTPLFDPFRRARLFHALSYCASGMPLIAVIKAVAGVYEKEGETDMTMYLQQHWLVSLKNASATNAANIIAGYLRAYNPKESFAFHLALASNPDNMANGWRDAAREASVEAERVGDESDYCRLGGRALPAENVFNFIKNRQPAKPIVVATA